MTLALDIGATNIRIAEVNGTTIRRKQKVKHAAKKSDILNLILKLISEYEKPKSICVATAGFEKSGKIQGALNMDFNDVPLRKILEKKFRVPVHIQNDARCAGLAELYYGSGKKAKNFVLLTLGTGIGGAIIIDRKLYLGNGTAGEVGSMIFDDDLFEHLASGSAATNFAKKEGLKIKNSYELEKLAQKNNRKAIAIYEKVGKYLGKGIVNLSYALSPEMFIIGGGFSEVEYIFPSARKFFSENYKIDPKPKIVKAKFGDDAGLIGAGLLEKI